MAVFSGEIWKEIGVVLGDRSQVLLALPFLLLLFVARLTHVPSIFANLGRTSPTNRTSEAIIIAATKRCSDTLSKMCRDWTSNVGGRICFQRIWDAIFWRRHSTVRTLQTIHKEVLRVWSRDHVAAGLVRKFLKIGQTIINWATVSKPYYLLVGHVRAWPLITWILKGFFRLSHLIAIWRLGGVKITQSLPASPLIWHIKFSSLFRGNLLLLLTALSRFSMGLWWLIKVIDKHLAGLIGTIQKIGVGFSLWPPMQSPLSLL